VNQFSRVTLALGVTLMACSPASAQFRPERPYRGIFASGVDNSTHSVVGNGTLSAGYDDDLLADATGRDQPVSNQQGILGQVSGGLSYTLNVDRVSLNAGAGSTVRYYPSLEREYFTTHNAGVNASARILNRPEVSLFGSANYQPVNFLSAFPALDNSLTLENPEPDFVPVESQYVAYAAGVSISQPLSRRMSVSASGTRRMADRLETDFWSQSANAALRVQMTRDVALRLGYAVSEAHYEGRPTVVSHRPDIGLDFARALSLTRRTSLSFGVGTDATVSSGETRWRASGHVALAHEIGRSWVTRAAYQRGTRFIETITEPVFSDSVQASLSGLLTRRIQFTSIASASIGSAGSNSRQFDSYRGSAGLSVALTRYMNTGVDYAYYRYLMDPLIALPSGVPSNVNRQSIRGHISLWVPVLNRPRRANASR